MFSLEVAYPRGDSQRCAVGKVYTAVRLFLGERFIRSHIGECTVRFTVEMNQFENRYGEIHRLVRTDVL